MKLNWRIIVQNGLLGGVVAFYLSAVGLTETFSQRFLIGTFFSTGQLFVTVGAIMAGILTARALKEQENDRNSYISSLLAGAVSSLPLMLLIFLIQVLVIPQIDQEVVFRWRDMFINFSPVLVDLLTFSQGLVIGIPLLILASMILAGIGSALVLLPGRWRVALLNALIWTLGIGLFSENVTQILNQFGAKFIIRFLFQAKSLNPLAALLIFVGAFFAAYFRVHKIAQDRWAKIPTNRQKRGRTVGIVMGILLLLALPWMVGQFLSQALFLVGLYVMMGLGLNIVVGYAGLLDLGYVAFFAIGAYTMGLFTSTGELGISNLNFWATLPVALLIGLMAGVLLGFPVLRMRGDYLAIVTLGFGEIIRIVATSDWLAPWEGGPQGILHIPNPSFFGQLMEKPQEMYYLVIAGSLLIAFVTIRLKDSRLGRQWMAMREDEDVAEAMGINLVQTKLLAFSVGAGFSALAGAILAARIGTIFPHSFNLIVSINALSLIIVGGMGSIPGVIVGSLILVGMPELLREFTEYRFLMYGILLIIMMLFRPEGFLPDVTRKRELRGGDENMTEEELATSEA
jgi:branched-chain amino acid transport system permease protein